jgi:tetratricopeptide (TPR) repeat protein
MALDLSPSRRHFFPILEKTQVIGTFWKVVFVGGFRSISWLLTETNTVFEVDMNRKERRLQKKMAKKTGNNEVLSEMLIDALELYRSGNLKQALKKCQSVLSTRPDDADAHSLSGSIHMDQGRYKQSIASFRASLKKTPDRAQSHYYLGTALAANGEWEEAISCQIKAIEIRPDYSEAHFNLGNAYNQTGDFEAAVVSYRAALDAYPDYPGGATNLANTLLRLNKPDDALVACDKALNSHPGDRDAFAFKAIAATEADKPGLADEILSMDKIIKKTDFKAPQGFADLKAFNSALAKHVLSHSTLTREPHNMATRNGQQTENLGLGSKGPIAFLEEMIIDTFDDYMETVAPNVDHHYMKQIPSLSKIDIWGTVLDQQGHQASHMHRNAWVSGVYYVQLPDVMHGPNEEQSGWIEFGRPPEEFPCQKVHKVQTFEPAEGRMFMFPSFEFHRTIPFESSEQRISIAFDLLA